MSTSAPAGPALEAITIESPCTADWDAMQGDERSRHCGECKLDVFDLTAMTRAEAESFLASRVPGARLCVRFQRRPDGRVVTDDCLTARERIARRARRVKAAASALFALVLPALTACTRPESQTQQMPTPPVTPHKEMGAMVVQPQPPAAPQEPETRQGDVCEPIPVPNESETPRPPEPPKPREITGRVAAPELPKTPETPTPAPAAR